MGRHPTYSRRPSDFKRGTVAPWPVGKPSPAEVARRARYRPSGVHKNYPSASRLWTPALRADKAKCGVYTDEEAGRIVEVLRQAISTPCVDREFRGDFPARAWAYVNGVLHEARLSNEANGEYHGFPLDYEEQWPDDPNDLLRKAPNVTFPDH